MKGLFENHSASVQLFILLATVIIGTGIASVISLLMIGVSGNVEKTPVWTLQLLQFLTAGGVFLLPAWLTAWLCSRQPCRFMRMHRLPDCRMILLVTLATLTLSPAISLSSYWNMQMQLPDMLAPLEAWMRQAEDAAAELVQRFVSATGIMAWLSNLLVIAVMAAVAEEFLFRGALFSILRRSIRNTHAVIWLVAVIFSAIHLQFYGFLPRMLLGAFLGYLLYLTDNLWVPVTAHFVNNALGVTALSSPSLREYRLLAGNIKPEDISLLFAAAGIGLLLFAVCVRKIYRAEKS
jgi:membrane protease YdiL (CAAX protease family)